MDNLICFADLSMPTPSSSIMLTWCCFDKSVNKIVYTGSKIIDSRNKKIDATDAIMQLLKLYSCQIICDDERGNLRNFG